MKVLLKKITSCINHGVSVFCLICFIALLSVKTKVANAYYCAFSSICEFFKVSNNDVSFIIVILLSLFIPFIIVLLIRLFSLIRKKISQKSEVTWKRAWKRTYKSKRHISSFTFLIALSIVILLHEAEELMTVGQFIYPWVIFVTFGSLAILFGRFVVWKKGRFIEDPRHQLNFKGVVKVFLVTGMIGSLIISVIYVVFSSVLDVTIAFYIKVLIFGCWGWTLNLFTLVGFSNGSFILQLVYVSFRIINPHTWYKKCKAIFTFQENLLDLIPVNRKVISSENYKTLMDDICAEVSLSIIPYVGEGHTVTIKRVIDDPEHGVVLANHGRSVCSDEEDDEEYPRSEETKESNELLDFKPNYDEKILLQDWPQELQNFFKIDENEDSIKLAKNTAYYEIIECRLPCLIANDIGHTGRVISTSHYRNNYNSVAIFPISLRLKLKRNAETNRKDEKSIMGFLTIDTKSERGYDEHLFRRYGLYLANRIAFFLNNSLPKNIGYGSSRIMSDKKIFIGHGRSDAWKDLRDFLERKLGLECVHYNSQPTAGVSTVERLSEMLEECSFAFLVMTGEDAMADNTIQSRMNVVHEVGLFQGRLGLKKAIVLLENGTTEFSNIVGLGQIRFEKDALIKEAEEIRDVLEREKII